MAKGYKTTEFWLTVAASLVGLTLASGAVSNEATLQVLGFISSALAAIGYTACRSLVKSSESTGQTFKELFKEHRVPFHPAPSRRPRR